MNRENKVDNNSQRAIQFIMNTGGFKDVCEPLAFRTKMHSYKVTYKVAKGSTILGIMSTQKRSMSWIEAERGCSSKLTFRNATYLEHPTYTDITPFFGDIHHPTKKEIQLACVIEPFICDCIAQVGKDLLNHFGGQ